jgi:hypothetical protein
MVMNQVLLSLLIRPNREMLGLKRRSDSKGHGIWGKKS